VSILRPTRLGTSLATDPLGRILASADYFVGDDQTMLATVPTEGVRTAYSLLGDVVAWASVVAVAVGGAVLGLSALRRKARRRTARG
jgi:apolipoprotein N-acyltransferase